jgi:hypothetical protein
MLQSYQQQFRVEPPRALPGQPARHRHSSVVGEPRAADVQADDLAEAEAGARGMA